MRVEVRVSSGAEQRDAVRALMRAFVAWHRETNPEEGAPIEPYYELPGSLRDWLVFMEREL